MEPTGHYFENLARQFLQHRQPVTLLNSYAVMQNRNQQMLQREKTDPVQVGLGSAAAIQERGDAWIIGVDTDWTVSAPEFADVVLTSILKNMDVAVFEASSQVVNGTFAGGLYVGTLENGGVGVSDPAVALDGLDDIMAGIIDGSIATSP